MRKLIALAATTAAVFACEAAVAKVATPTSVAIHYSNKWRLQISDGANIDGVIHFRLTP